MKNANTALDKLDKALTEAKTCPVLKKHILTVFANIDDLPIPNSLGESLLLGADIANKAKPLELYLNLPKEFYERHKISKGLQNDLVSHLELYAIVYCLYAITPLSLRDLSEELKKLNKISAAAKKLQSILPQPDSDLYGLIKMLEATESANLHSKNADQYFSQMNTYLNTLINLKSILQQTALGQLTKVGQKASSGNITLRIWILLIYDIWTTQLGRSFQYDGVHGFNGPTRFTEFAFDTILLLHPSVEHSQIEYAVRAFRNQPENTHVALKPKIGLTPS